MKLSGPNGKLDITDDTVPHHFLGSRVSVAIQDLGVSDPTILIFVGGPANATTTALGYAGLHSDLTGYVRIISTERGVVPDTTNLRRVDGKDLTPYDFDAVVQSLEDDGHFEYAVNVIKSTLDPRDPWPHRD